MKTFPRILLMIVATFAILVFGLCALIFTSLGGMQAFYTPFLLVLVPGLLILAVLWIFSLAGNKVRKLVTLVFLGIMFISVAGYHAINAWFANIPTVSDASGADTPTVAFDLQGNAYRVGAAVFSRDLQWLAAWRLPDQVEVWDVAKGTKVAEWTAGPAAPGLLMPSGRSRPLAFLGDGKKLLVATATNLAIRDLLSGQIEQTLDESGTDLEQISVAPDGSCVAGVIQKPDFEFAFWSLPDGRRLTHLPTKRAPWEPRLSPFTFSAFALPVSMSPGTGWAFSPDGELFAIGHPFAVDVWDLKVGKWISRFTGMDVPEFRIGAVTFSGATTVAFLSSSNLAMVCGGALAVLSVGTNLTPVVVANPTGTPKERLEIRAFGVSADGKRLAVAGMRMASRKSYGDPGGGPVFDGPQQGEIQVWEAVPLRLLVTIRGNADEKFSGVALDGSGKRVAAVTSGVRYTAKMNYYMQQAAERSPPGPYRVAAWDVP